jgi:hypothetical protein
MPTTLGRRVLEFRNPFLTTQNALDEEDIRSGSSFKDWKFRFERGLDCSTIYSRKETEVVSATSGYWQHICGYVQVVGVTPQVVFQSSARGAPFEAASWPSITVPITVENAVKSAFLNRMDETRKSLQSITVLGELGRTVKMITHPMASLRRGINAYFSTVEKRGSKALRLNGRRTGGKSSDPRRSLALRQALTGTYLEFQFGIRPTLSDISNGIEAAHRLGGRVVNSQRISASSDFEQVVSSTRGIFVPGSFVAGQAPLGPTSTAQVKLFREVRVKGRVRYSGNIGIDVSPTPVKELGFMPRDFLPDVWNFLPWSWAIDYVFNVGSVLQALCGSYSDLIWCNRAVTTSAIQTQTSDSLVDIWGISDPTHRQTIYLGESVPSRVVLRKMEYYRSFIEPTVTQFMPQFALRMPGVNQLLNLAAVAHQQVRVSKRFRAIPSGPEFSRLDDLHIIR